MDEDEYEDEEDRLEAYTVNSIYINENDELSFDLSKETWDFGNYWGEEKLSNVTLEFILEESFCDLELEEDELDIFIKQLKKDSPDKA